MATPTTPANAARMLKLPVSPGGLATGLASAGRRRPVDRDAALRQVRNVRHHLLPRHERFQHLKRTYD